METLSFTLSLVGLLILKSIEIVAMGALLAIGFTLGKAVVRKVCPELVEL